jgi:gliding motility-associated-like protein
LTVTIKVTTSAKCFGDANGKVEVVLAGDATLMATAKGVIKDSAGKEYNNGSLPAGDYTYIVYGTTGKKLGSAPFKITQPDLIVAKATATEVCKTNLGTITVDVSGGTKPYEFVWADLTANQTQNRTGLAQGLYSLQIKDANGCIRSLVDVSVGKCKDSTVIINPNAKDTMIVLTLKAALATKCFGDANGSVEVTMSGDSTNIATSSYIITDKTGKKYDNGKLPAGDYLFIVSNSKGKAMDTVAFVIKQPIALIATAKVTDVCKTTLGSIELTVDGGVNPYAYKWDDLSTTISEDTRTGLSKGSYNVIISDANDCIFEVKDIVVGICKDTTNVNPNVPCAFDAFAGKETLTALIPNCDDLAAICVPLTNVKTINVDGKDTPITPCVGSFYSAATLLKGTSFVIKDWTLGTNKYSGAVQSVQAIADSLNKWDAPGKWAYDSNTKHITGGAANQTYGILNIQDVTASVPLNYGLNYVKGTDGTLLKLYKGDHIVIAKNDKNCTDTLKISVKCDFKAPKPDTIYLTMLITESKTACLDVSELSGVPVSVTEGCMNQYLADATMLANNCIKFTGVNIGTDTICFTSCDANGICDVTYVILDVNKPFKDVIDTISVTENKKYCIHPGDYGIEGAFTMKTTCDQKVDGNISFVADQNGCIEYLGLKTGNDTICVEVCDKAGKCGNFKIFVNVRPQIIIPGTGSQDIIFKDTILIGDIYDYCVPLPLGFVPVSVKNTCPQTSGNASFDLNNKTACIKYTGLTYGIDTACITLCDANNDCFKATMIIWVEKIIVMPLARDDNDTTVVGGKILIDEMKNDIIPGKLVEMKLLSKPRLGSLVMTNTMKMEYSNNKDECGVVDTFNYYICNQDGCDTAKVSIYIRCAKVKVYSGFSPNGDASNETFTIMDIDQFPNNELRIFNRWGNEVMFEKGYKNTWKGTWNNQNLPDGTYFYLLDLGDREHTMFSGYLQIQR